MELAKIGVSRFYNIDNVTCYMNSILAVLQQTPIFTDYILTGRFKDILLLNPKFSNDINKLEYSILLSFHNLLYLSHTNDNVVIRPTKFRKIIELKDSTWGNKEQQDSQEFLTFLLNSIE